MLIKNILLVYLLGPCFRLGESTFCFVLNYFPWTFSASGAPSWGEKETEQSGAMAPASPQTQFVLCLCTLQDCKLLCAAPPGGENGTSHLSKLACWYTELEMKLQRVNELPKVEQQLMVRAKR